MQSAAHERIAQLENSIPAPQCSTHSTAGVPLLMQSNMHMHCPSAVQDGVPSQQESWRQAAQGLSASSEQTAAPSSPVLSVVVMVSV